jgi:LysR family hydrogen peroxide-inducible transcriptional activator
VDLRQLAALAAVADHRSFSAAARALHTVQSNVSSHIANLERELGVALVDRASGGLTEEGEIVLARARRVQTELDGVVSDLAAHAGEVTGTVRLGLIGTVGSWLLPLLLPALAEAHPGIHLAVVDATTTSLVPQVVAGTLDAAVVNLPVVEPDLLTEPLLEEDRVLLVPSGHPLAARRRRTVGIEDLAGHALLLEPPGTAFRDDLDAAAARAGVELTALAEVDGMRALAGLAQDGYGPAVLPSTAATTDGAPTPGAARVRRLAITGLAPRSVGMASSRRSRPTAPARAVGQLVRDLVAEHAPRLEGVRSLGSSDAGEDEDASSPDADGTVAPAL